MVKLVTLFLVVVVALALFGKLGWLGRIAPTRSTPRVRRTRPADARDPDDRVRDARPVTCIHCGQVVTGTRPCACGKG